MTNQQIASAIVKTERMKAVIKMKHSDIEVVDTEQLAIATQRLERAGVDFDIKYFRETNQDS